MNTAFTPVLIVGGGPVGLALAIELGWRGIACTLIEQGDGKINMPKMNEVNTRTMEFCRRWGIASDVKNCPFPMDYPMDVVAVTRLGAHELGRVERPARKDQRPGVHSPENLQVCPQHWFDPILAARARSFPTVRLLYGHKINAYEMVNDGIRADITDAATGTHLNMDARFLVGCDGAGSSVRRAAGIELVGKETLSNSMHLFFRAPGLLDAMGVRTGTFFTLVDDQGLWGNLRSIDPQQNLWRLLFDVPEDFDTRNVDREAWLRRAIARPVSVEWTHTSHWTRRGVVADRLSYGPVFIAGDAAHQVSPTGALGMNTGIADAVDLGWKLAAVISGWGGSHLLDTYDEERRPAGARTVRMATEYYEGQAQFDEGLDAITAESGKGEDARRRIGPQVMAHVSRVFRTLGLQIGYRYEGSSICVDDGSPVPPDDPGEYLPIARPGARAPHVALNDGRSTLDLFGKGFVLLRLGAGAPDGQALADAAAARDVPLERAAIAEPDVLRTYERALVLVRPDGHVAWRGDRLPDNCLALIDTLRGAAIEA
jgi:2-polyprenyl-6-methoxyphenol hydroxylase-like FAD-dependent oxidoreductase